MFFDPALGGKLLLLQVCLLILVGSIANFTVKLYRIRKRFQSLQRDGLVSWAATPFKDSCSRYVSMTMLNLSTAHAPPSSDIRAFTVGR